jgi:hypothetical protein
MKKTIMVAIVAVAIVAAAGVTLYTSQAPQPEMNDLASIEQKLNDLQDFTEFENLDDDFGIGDVAGIW